MKQSFFSKNILVILALVCTTFAVQSCKKEEDTTTPTPASTLCKDVIGNWKVTSWTVSGVNQFSSDDIKGLDLKFDGASTCSGTLTWTQYYDSGNIAIDFSYSTDAGAGKITVSAAGQPITFSASVSGTQLTMTQGTETIKATKQ